MFIHIKSMVEDVVNRTWVPCENCEDKPDKNNRTAIRKRQNHKTILRQGHITCLEI